MATNPAHVPLDGFSHEALLYANEDEFLGGTLSFMREGLEQDEPMLVVLAAHKNERLRSELGDDGWRVLFADMGEVGANPARIIPAWQGFVSARADDETPVRGIGEPISSARRGPELVECQRHESLLNLAFAETPSFRLLCPYDTTALDGSVIDEALRSHPYVQQAESTRLSKRYRGLKAVAAPFDEPLPKPPPSALELRFEAGSLGDVRSLVAEQARHAGIGEPRTSDLVLAVNEIATNSVRHGGEDGVLRIWSGAEWLLCEVADSGRIEDPLVGRRSPSTEERSGRGVWIANQVCELVQVRSHAWGSVVRLHMRRTER
jgi:anti-sigma regulatory factor (Ser/Thr protein kinase)